MRRYGHYVANEWLEPGSGQYFPVRNPYTGEIWAEAAAGNPQDVAAAVAAAKEAFENGPWSRLTASERGALLRRLGDLLAENASVLAETQVRENGKPIAETLPQTVNAPTWLHYYAGLADKIESQVVPFDRPDHLAFTRYEPLGVVAAIIPWNSPLRLMLWKLGPALAAGNTLVIKPSEYTPISSLLFAELAAQAGFPPGVLNIVNGTGSDVARPLIEHPSVAKVAFTGGEQNGRSVYRAAAEGLKPVTLELGGKSPNIVFADADFELAVTGAAAAIFGSTGQTCLAGSRLLVEETIHDRFVDALAAIASGIRHGDPMDPATELGPVATKAQFDRILDYIELAKREGATVRHGGKPLVGPECKEGLFVAPTILTGVTNAMRIAREEVFGPVVCVIPFKDEAEAVAIANDTDYGLAAGVWTENLNRAHRVSARLRAGVVWVNTYRVTSPMTPFGGYKNSGLGREGGAEMIKQYLQTKSVCINLSGKVGTPFRRKG